MARSRIPALVAAPLLLWGSAAVFAQVPGAALPGQIERQFQPLPTPRAQPPETPGAAPVQAQPENAAAIRFPLKSLSVEGATIYPEAALRPFYEGLLGKEVSLADIYGVANAITAKYRNDGYILSQAIVPPQQVSSGTVRLTVIEGYVAQVKSEGDTGGRRDVVDAIAEKITRARPLTARVLERYLLLLNDLPGVAARATLAPSATQAGASDLLIQFSRRPYSAGVNIDNHGSKTQGPWRLTADAEVHSLLGRHDKTSLKAATTGNRELNYVTLGHEQPVGSEGGKLAGNATLTRSETPIGGVAPATVKSASESFTLTYTHPLLRSRSTNLYGRVSLGAHNGDTDIDATNISEDRVRALRLGATWDYADSLLGINIVDVELSQGLNALGARRSGSEKLSRATGKSDFTKVTLYGARLQSITGAWSVLAAVNAQYAFSDLLTPELFGVGGDQFGRGYDPSELVGDSGAALKLELRYARNLPYTLLSSYTAYSFYDLGTVNQRSLISNETSGSAASAGVGLRFNAGRYLSGFLEFAKPLTRAVQTEGDRDLRTYFGLAARF